MAFESHTIHYTGQDGTPLVLRTGYYHGFKAYWIEDESGKKLTKPVFYNESAIECILSNANVSVEPPESV